MEVHHKHHVPKNIKEYLTEFLMLFAAVTLGFFAENIREHIVNAEKEHMYVQNFKRGIIEQNEKININISKNTEKIKILDILVELRNKDIGKKNINDSVIKLFIKASIWEIGILKINDIAIQQIKSTGGLNLIRSNLSNIITEVDMSNQELKTMQQYTESHAESAIRMLYELTDVPSIFTDKGFSKQLPLILIDDKKKLLKFFNLIFDTRATLNTYNLSLEQHQKTLNKALMATNKEFPHN